MNKIHLGANQKRILDILINFPNSTITEAAQTLYGKPIIAGSKEYNSVCRSFHLLEERGLIAKSGGQIRWHVNKNVK